MRCVSVWCTLIVSILALSSRAADISYGNPRELKGVQSVYVWQTDPPSMKEQALAELKALPGLVIAEHEEGSDAVLVIKRRSSESKTGGETSFVTSGMVVRSFGPERSHIIMEPVSLEADQAAAVRAVTQEFIAELQRANGEKYGKAPPAKLGKPTGPRFRSTAGLRSGMTKDQVREAVGTPTRIDGKGARTQIWWYETTDGATRVVFGGDAVLTVQFVERNK